MNPKNFLKKVIKNLFGAKNDSNRPVSFYLTDFLFRKILNHNSSVKWPLHFTSTIHSADKLVIGDNTFPGDSPGVYINAINGVIIGDHTNIGPRVSIISANHDSIDNEHLMPGGPINIGKYCWIGANATILPNVTLGDFTVVGAGAIVTKSFKDGYCVIAGNPAKIIRQQDKSKCIAFQKTKNNLKKKT